MIHNIFMKIWYISYVHIWWNHFLEKCGRVLNAIDRLLNWCYAYITLHIINIISSILFCAYMCLFLFSIANSLRFITAKNIAFHSLSLCVLLCMFFRLNKQKKLYKGQKLTEKKIRKHEFNVQFSCKKRGQFMQKIKEKPFIKLKQWIVSLCSSIRFFLGVYQSVRCSCEAKPPTICIGRFRYL